MAESKGIQVKGKQEVATAAEQTKPELVFTPVVDIFESEQDLTVFADMPGVKPEDLTIDLNDNVLTMVGALDPPEAKGEVDVMREYRTGRYYRQFTISDVIDQSKIEAVLYDGVLRLTLPKAEKAKPRQIAVKTG